MSISAIKSTSGEASVKPIESRPSTSQSAERNLQDVFSAVLEQVGRSGYESSQPLNQEATSASSLEKEVGSSWEQWFNEFSQTRYSFIADAGSPSVRENKTASDLQEDFKQILVDAYQQGGYATPNAYLQSLSSEQLRTIQQVQHLADPIQVARLSDEASLNLLLPPDAQVDEDHDGLTAVGAAYTIRFPDSRTPAKVRDAWESATQGLSESDRLTYELQMSLPLLTANMYFDSKGQYVRSSQPGDADWINPMASDDFSYVDAATGWLEYLQRFKNQIPPEQYQKDESFWSNFRSNLL